MSHGHSDWPDLPDDEVEFFYNRRTKEVHVNQAAQRQQPQPRMTLAAVTKGRIEQPLRVLLYGTEGLGKSTFGSNAPRPIFLSSEDGTSHLDVERLPEPQTWADVLDAINLLVVDDHTYKTLVIDTLDWLEPLCHAEVCSKPDEKGRKHSSIISFGYGKGFDRALDVWRVFVSRLERLRAVKGMTVVMLAHAQIKTFKNPEGEDFDRYEMKVHAKAAGLLREWCDVVLFGAYETFTREGDSGRIKGVSSGARVVHTQRTAAWDAKNRRDLPPTLPLDWDAFMEAVKAHQPADPAALLGRIAALLEGSDDQFKALVAATVAKANGNAAQLAKIVDRVAAKVQIAKQENGQ